MQMMQCIRLADIGRKYGSNPQETGCQVPDFISVLKLRHCGVETFLERLGLVSVLKVWENGTPRSRLGLVT